MSKTKSTPRKFSEKIALLNKKEAEGNAEFEKILKEVELTTRAPPTQASLAPFHHPHHQSVQQQHQQHHQHHHRNNQQQQQQSKQYYGLPQRSSSFSNWQRCGFQLHPPSSHQSQQQNHGQYLTQPMQYNSNHVQQQQQQLNQLYIDQQQVPRQQQQQPPQHHQNAYLGSHQTQQPFQQPQQNHNQHQHSAHHVQQRQQLSGNQIGTHNVQSLQTAPLDVPNIEIFPIDDDDQASYQQVTSAPITADTLSDGHFRNDCSNSSISSARSLPNIANLSVSPTSSCFSPRTSIDQGVVPQVSMSSATSTSTTAATTAFNNATINDQHLMSSESRVTSSGQQHNDAYATTTATTNDYYNNDDYCSLPAIQEPMQTINRNDISRQSQGNLSRNSSWQSLAVTSSAPNSAAPTPPSAANSYDCNQVHSQQHSPISTSRQQSPQHQQQLLHQDYYPTQQQQQQQQQLHPQGQMIRASSINVLGDKYPTNDLLEAPRLNNNLSKSSEACYGYLDDYVIGDGYSNGNGHTGDGENFGDTGHNFVEQPTTVSLMRSHSGSNLDYNINDCKLTNSQQLQFVDTSQQPFYG